jgi:hypothetical protein
MIHPVGRHRLSIGNKVQPVSRCSAAIIRLDGILAMMQSQQSIIKGLKDALPSPLAAGGVPRLPATVYWQQSTRGSSYEAQSASEQSVRNMGIL